MSWDRHGFKYIKNLKYIRNDNIIQYRKFYVCFIFTFL